MFEIPRISAGLQVEQTPRWTRQDQTEGSGGHCPTPSRVPAAGGGQAQSALLCVSVKTTKATKRRSRSFSLFFFSFVSFSWEQQVEAALWFYVFTTGAINSRACVAFWLSYLHLPAPQSRRLSLPHGQAQVTAPAPAFSTTWVRREETGRVSVFCCYFCFRSELSMHPTHTGNAGSKTSS